MVACGLYRAAFAFLTVKLAFLHAFGRKRAFFRNMDSFVLLHAALCHGINSAYTGGAFIYKRRSVFLLCNDVFALCLERVAAFYRHNERTSIYNI